MRNAKNAKRVILKILFVCMIMLSVSCLILSCGNDGGTPDIPENAKDSGNDNAGNPEATQEQKPALDLPEIKYDGYAFRILNVPQSEVTWVYTTLCANEENGDGVNDAVYRRNKLAEDRFGIEIKEITGSSRKDVYQKAANVIKAGADDYDLVMLSLDDAGPVGLAQTGMLADYNQIPYIDLTQIWWDRDIVRDLSVGGRNYFVAGDFSMMHYGNTMGMIFNKKLLVDLGLESPYGAVKAGKWTFDKFHEMTKNASKDLDGDGVFTKSDQYGYMAHTFVWAQGFMASAGQQMISKDKDDMHAFNMKDEKFIETYKKLLEIMYDGDILFDTELAGDHDLPYLAFPNNQVLFYSNVIHNVVRFRDMESDFGIIPFPKFDENQSGYLTYIYPPPVMCVPVTAQNLERTGVILEALCYESTDTVIKAYYDVLLKTKISRDDESEGMLDIIFQNRFYSIADIFYFGETYNQFYQLSQKKDANLASWIEKNEAKIIAAIDKNNQAFSKNE